MNDSSATVAPTTSSKRLVALDWMRGFVIALMAVDHASGEFNKGRLMADSAFFFKAGTALPAGQFFTRWITHLCAPTFVLLAGTSMALSIRRRTQAGASALSIDAYLLSRGALIVALEIVPSTFWMDRGQWLFQVLYGIGSSFILMVPLRRLPAKALVAIAIAIVVGGEATIGLAGWGPPEKTPLIAALLLVPGPHGALIIAYPTLHWLAILLFGWVLGVYLLDKRPDARSLSRILIRSGLAFLAVFVVVRGANRYGNMLLYRDGWDPVQWLHVSKYPPSLSYVTLEVGIALCILSWLVHKFDERAPHPASPMLLLGRTPMFFYLLHIPLLAMTAKSLSVEHQLGLWSAYVFGVLVTALLYLPCTWYGQYKAAHPNGWTRYV